MILYCVNCGAKVATHDKWLVLLCKQCVKNRHATAQQKPTTLPCGLSCTGQDEINCYNASNSPLGSVEEISNSCHPRKTNRRDKP